MRTIIIAIDRINAWVGKVFAWTIMVMSLGMGYEVLVRYLLSDPTSWAYDMSYMMYGTLFMMAGAYTLSRDGHVRGDVLYRLWKPKTQARVELILYILFFFPAVTAFIFAGWHYASESWMFHELSPASPANVPIFQFKTIIPVTGGFLFLQGIAQVMRCIVCLRTGEWPAHLEDVEEMETMLLHSREDEAIVRAEFDAAGDKKQ